MKSMFLQDKKGVSEIISYVILIVIAISISALVYNYISNLVPKERPECKEDLSLSIESYACRHSYLNLTVKNRGKFNISAAYIRIGEEGYSTRYWINNEESNQFQYAPPLGPNSLPRQIQYNIDSSNPVSKLSSGQEKNFIREVQIAYWDVETKKYAACKNAIVQTINCKYS